MSCPYRNVFGREGEGIHSFRIFGLAVVDLLATLAAALLLSYLSKVSVFIMFPALIILAVGVHRVFCVNTALNVKIFGHI